MPKRPIPTREDKGSNPFSAASKLQDAETRNAVRAFSSETYPPAIAGGTDKFNFLPLQTRTPGVSRTKECVKIPFFCSQ